MGAAGSVPDSGRLGPELSHEIRGLRAWLPLHLHGVDAFREALDEKLDLAEHVHGRCPASRNWRSRSARTCPP
ncbi:hypothetical protein ACWCPF_37915 [Streptomyces sp. NPDC001858]